MGFSEDSVRLTRSALGRVGFLGELYNARTEEFSSRSLLKSNTPSSLIVRQDIGKTDYDYKFTESISDRFDLLKVEAELQVGIMCGLITVAGGGKFLQEEKKSFRTVSCSLICKLQTVCEKLFGSFDEIVPYLDLTALEDSQYTHVVIEVNWGANCLLTLEAAFDSEKDKKTVEGRLKAEVSFLGGLLKVKGKGSLENEKGSTEDYKDLEIKVEADVNPRNRWPTSVEAFQEFLCELPQMVRNLNEGKGKPLTYAMIPLSTIKKVAKLEIGMNVFVKAIDECALISIIYLFEDISEIKKKLFDLIKDIKTYKKFLPSETLENARRHQENLLRKESSLKDIIRENWVVVKSGEKPFKDFIRDVEKFKIKDLNLYSFEEYLESCDSIQRKIAEVRGYNSKGIICLGKGDKIDDVVSKDPNSNIIILVTSPELKKADEDLFLKTSTYFLSLSMEKTQNTKYVVVELEDPQDKDSLNFLNVFITGTRCFHLKGSTIISHDMFAQYLFLVNYNLGRLRRNLNSTYVHSKPPNRVQLEMVCPGQISGSCSSKKQKWNCVKCRSDLSYGFDRHLYCSCGMGLASDFEFRCSDPKHGNTFVEAPPDFLKSMLSVLKPLPQMNLLILGQSGVGKSTWINSIINYLIYESMEKAKEERVTVAIPITLSEFDPETKEMCEIRMGKENSNEVTSAGDSATQYPHTYSFLWRDKCVRLIDTPGLGDTKGISKDKENMANIIAHIGHFNELHGVCILIKANDNRTHVVYSYCIKELLTHLHKSVARNIVFCFTNSRTTFYNPGKASVMLEKLIRELKIEKEVKLGHHNMFCLDNEAFIFLCSLTGGSTIKYPENLVKSFADSWKISQEKTMELFETVKSFKPHLLKETLSLVTARYRIITLTKPIAEISKTIQLNVAAAERKKVEIENSHKTLAELGEKLKIIDIQLEPVPLDYPRTVCTSPSCVNRLSYKSIDVTEIEYITHCHDQCYLKNVEPKTVNNAALKYCWAMSNGRCTMCACSWENHMHLTYEQKRVEKEAVNKTVEEDMCKEKTEKEKKEQFLRDLEERITKYQKELDFIMEVSVKFGVFLKENAISVYNDSVAEYLKHLINEEENKLHKTKEEENLIKAMKQTLDRYEAEARVLQEVIDSNSSDLRQYTVEDIFGFEEQLYKLELTGEEIRKNAEVSRISNASAMQYQETPLQLHSGSTSKNREKGKKEKIEKQEKPPTEGNVGIIKKILRKVWN